MVTDAKLMQEIEKDWEEVLKAIVYSEARCKRYLLGQTHSLSTLRKSMGQSSPL